MPVGCGYSGGGKEENGGKFCCDLNPLAEGGKFVIDTAEGGYDCDGVVMDV